MARMLQFAAVTLLGFSLTGCVAAEKYNALKLERDRLVEQNAFADAETSRAKGEAAALRNNMNAILNGGNNKDAMLVNLQTQLSQALAANADLQSKYEGALNRTGPGAQLPQQLNDALEQFARQNPDLVDFDSARGMVKFKSDVTFATGSADLTEPARTGITRFAQILNSDVARGYELMVAGHTDNQPVNNPETKRRGHLDNWYLSAHRAISVSSELQKHSVGGSRIAIVGYGEQRPIADNTSTQGRQQNRRVEVLILPTQARAGAPQLAGSRTPAPPAVPPKNANLNKDTPPERTQPPVDNNNK